ncbi:MULTISPECIES: hypothetical protein [unclassified Sutcliffiella]|uniref:hypothetical protein n=1 Tax=unclassified Sutcliffiella TaxID=2837532 RepID=UPI0030D2107F
MKKLINALGILGLGLLLSIYPYKIYQEKKNLDNLNQWLANPENKEFLFNENLQLIEVENLGNDIYNVEAEGDKRFLIKYKKNRYDFYIQLYLEGQGMQMFLEYK